MSEWKEYRLGDICQTNKSQYSAKENWKNFLYLDTGNITKGIVDDIQEFDSFVNLPSRARRKVEDGDIIYSSVRPNQEHYGYISNPPINLLVSTGFVVISANKDIINPLFLYNYLTRTKITKYLQAIGEQSVCTYPAIKPSDIENLIVKIPSIKIQIEIASILSSLDDKIAVNRRICENLEAQAQALFKHWFIDFAPFKNGKFVESELGMIPEGWRVGKLEEIIDVKYGKDHKKLLDGNIPVYGSGGLMRKADKLLYEGESVLIPRKGTLNNVMYVNEAFWTVDTMFYSIPKMPNIALFTYMLLRKKDLASMNAGSAVPSMTTDILNKMQLIIPNEDVLEHFNSLVSALYVLKKHNEQESSRLSALRDTLLPKLMSGEIKV